MTDEPDLDLDVTLGSIFVDADGVAAHADDPRVQRLMDLAAECAARSREIVEANRAEE